jgi:putative flippase GtrA
MQTLSGGITIYSSQIFDNELIEQHHSNVYARHKNYGSWIPSNRGILYRLAKKNDYMSFYRQLEKLQQVILQYNQLIKYGIIGCFCAGLDFIVYTGIVELSNISYLYANIISVHCGVFASFLLNRHFTFKIKDNALLRFISFYIIGIIGLLASSGLLIVFVEKMHLNELLSKGITVIFVALIQFLLNKYISFKHGR